MLVVVLKAWVTEMKETPCASNSSTSLAKSASDRDRPSTPSDRLLVTAEAVLSHARECHPGETIGVARAEVQGFANVSLRSPRSPAKCLRCVNAGRAPRRIFQR